MIEKVGAVITTATLITGCTPNIVQSLTPSILYPEISTDNLPDTLPSAVTDQIPNVVSVLGSIPFLGKTEICSGVRIDFHDYLSAGHCDYSLASDALPLCVELSINSPVDTPTDNGIELSVTKKVGYYDGDSSGISTGDLNSIPDDILLVETSGEARPYTTPTTISDTTTITSGTPLFLVNFEPTEDGKLRSPNANFLTDEEIRSGLTRPAILGAIALKRYANGMIAAIAGIKTYSTPPETEVRGGASGGPVYDQSGNLVGTAINLISYSNILDVENSFGISIPSISSQANVNVFLIQDISNTYISDLQEQQKPTETC